MRYTDAIEIALPRETVVALLADPAQLPRWLRGLVLHEPVDGVHGEVGTTSRVVLRTGQHTMEATETITRRERADGVLHYEREITAPGMWNAARERLTAAGPESTLWVSENEYRFDSVPMRLMGHVLRGVFRRQSRQHMNDFKAFAEQGTDVRDATEA
ncbi:SRPBCC family protein [Actinomycetospora flava]|uniref:SRPBCC family protein n=1 Tax=Actinomycetospora flava TaxID=3129232 RepID=A0ABU8MB33_9PSEU